MNGHLFVPNDLEEMRWVSSRAYTRGDWHWMGFFCSTGNSHEVRDSRTVTRENTALIASKLTGARGAQPLNHAASACWMNQSEKKDSEYDKLSSSIHNNKNMNNNNNLIGPNVGT